MSDITFPSAIFIFKYTISSHFALKRRSSRAHQKHTEQPGHGGLTLMRTGDFHSNAITLIYVFNKL